MYGRSRLGAVIPAYNEAASIALVVTKLRALTWHGVPLLDRVVVCDNGSVDATAELASAAGALVVSQPQKGYGHACLSGLAALGDCELVVFVDGDNSSEPEELLDLLAAWEQGAQLVIGARSAERREAGAMGIHQRFGNWLAGFLMTSIWGQRVTDLGPFRLIEKTVLLELDMQELTFGWTVEMQAKVLMKGLSLVEVPVTSVKRIGKSKVSGTFKGSMGATYGILSTIFKCWRISKFGL